MTSFTFPDRDDAEGPWPIFERIVRDFPELQPLNELLKQDCLVGFAMRRDESWMRNGKSILGMCMLPGTQGQLKPMFEQLLDDVLGYFPSWLILLDATWWEAATPLEREALVFHEALHAGQKRDKWGELSFNPATGAPTVGIIGHDVESFDAEVSRYGPWTGDIASFLAAAKRGPPAAEVQRYTPPPVDAPEGPF